MWLTPQLRFTNHIKKMVNKARGKVGYIFEKLNISFLPMKVALQVFNCYILPIITYGLAVFVAVSLDSMIKLFVIKC